MNNKGVSVLNDNHPFTAGQGDLICSSIHLAGVDHALITCM